MYKITYLKVGKALLTERLSPEQMYENIHLSKNDNYQFKNLINITSLSNIKMLKNNFIQKSYICQIICIFNIILKDVPNAQSI